MEEKHAIRDNQEDKIAELIECIQKFRTESPLTVCLSTLDAKLSHHLCRRLNDVQRSLHLVKKEIEPLTPSPSLDSCLLLQLEEQVGRIETDLLDVTRDILSSEKEEEDLLDQKDRLCKGLFDLSLQIKRLLHDQPSSPSMPENQS